MTVRRPTIAIGPKMPGWGSWDWLGEDLLVALVGSFRTIPFEGLRIPKCDVAVFIKHLPELPPETGGPPVVFVPVDRYGSPSEIDDDGSRLRRCSRIVVHCRMLGRYFSPFASVEFLDHHVKYVSAMRTTYRSEGYVLWIGVRSNLPPLVEWANRTRLPAPLVILTNPATPGRIGRAGDYGFHSVVDVNVEEWTPERHLERTRNARAAFDIKGDDFRSRHKPPTKAMDFLASGVPFATGTDGSVAAHLRDMGFEPVSPEDSERWLSSDYWSDASRFGTAIRELLSLERVAARWRRMLLGVLAERRD